MEPDVADSVDPVEYFQAATIEHSHSDLQYDFMVVDLLDIIDSNYRIHLAADVFSLMGYKGPLVIDDTETSTSTSWNEKFQLHYQHALMVDPENWVEMHKSTPMASKNHHFKWIEALPCRMEMLLDLAYQEHPVICYELFSSLTCTYHAFTSSFSFMIDMHFTTG